jgi:hypothetical protein
MTPGVAEVTVEAHHPGGRIQSDERMPSGRRAYGKTFGPDLHRDAQTMSRVTQAVDRKGSRYRKRVVNAEGVVVKDVDEPLTTQRGHGPDPGKF